MEESRAKRWLRGQREKTIKEKKMNTIKILISVISASLLLVPGLSVAQVQSQQSALAAQVKTLKDRHGAAWPISPNGYVTKQQCMNCHGPYEKLAHATRGVNPNPHNSHLGQVNCEDCHKGNTAEPVLMCNQCHNFKLKRQK